MGMKPFRFKSWLRARVRRLSTTATWPWRSALWPRAGQRGRWREIGAGLFDEGALVEHVGLGHVHLGLGLRHRGLEFLRIDAGHELIALTWD
jgi:hypothetical protein